MDLVQIKMIWLYAKELELLNSKAKRVYQMALILNWFKIQTFSLMMKEFKSYLSGKLVNLRKGILSTVKVVDIQVVVILENMVYTLYMKSIVWLRIWPLRNCSLILELILLISNLTQQLYIMLLVDNVAENPMRNQLVSIVEIELIWLKILKIYKILNLFIFLKILIRSMEMQ